MTTKAIEARAAPAFQIWDNFLWSADPADPDFEKQLDFIGMWHSPGFQESLVYYVSLNQEERDKLIRIAESRTHDG